VALCCTSYLLMMLTCPAGKKVSKAPKIHHLVEALQNCREEEEDHQAEAAESQKLLAQRLRAEGAPQRELDQGCVWLVVILNIRDEFISFDIWLDEWGHPCFLFGWRGKDERDDNYYLIVF
jgi:hypothetical protein